ncbi:MAG: FtsW/RodA/SpoVE family cell cycle protein [Planctomycetota bacterium]
MSPRRLLRDLDWYLVLLAGALALMGLLFVDSATADVDTETSAAGKHALVLAAGAVVAVGVVVVHYARFMRAAWLLYGLSIVSLLLLPWFGMVINGARRWYRLPGGFALQPAEFAKLALIVVLASYLRFRHKATTWEGLFVPVLITLVPAALILKQPDLGSSMVLWPVLLAMCFVAGTPLRAVLGLLGVGALALGVGYLFMHDYQRTRIQVWLEHFDWQPEVVPIQPEEPAVEAAAAKEAHAAALAVYRDEREAYDRMQTLLRSSAYQPWQALIAIGSGGMSGFGVGNGPQNVHGFLPYRESDYIFAVVAEETGFVGGLLVIGLELALAVRILTVAARSRERFGRLLAVGVAVYLAAQSLMHVAVCAWVVPATGLPMPFLSQGGSSTLAALLAVALVANVSARREPVLAADGFV